MAEETVEVDGFADIVSGAAKVPGSSPTPDCGAWMYPEPEAVVVIRNGEHVVSVPTFSRANDHVQFFDSAEHMYWSTQHFAALGSGVLTLEWEQAVRILGAHDGDPYDGFG